MLGIIVGKGVVMGKVSMTVNCIVVMDRVGVAVGSKVSRWRIGSVAVGMTTGGASGEIVATIN